MAAIDTVSEVEEIQTILEAPESWLESRLETPGGTKTDEYR
jgi:hypothetical protein